MGTSLYGVGVFGVVLLLFTGSISVVGFFRRHAPGESEWGTLVVPALAAAALLGRLVLMIHNYSLLTGSKTFWINDLPALLPVAALIGAYVGPPGPRASPWRGAAHR